MNLKKSKEVKNHFEIITKQLNELQTNISKAEEDWKNKNAKFNIYLEEWKDKIEKIWKKNWKKKITQLQN